MMKPFDNSANIFVGALSLSRIRRTRRSHLSIPNRKRRSKSGSLIASMPQEVKLKGSLLNTHSQTQSLSQPSPRAPRRPRNLTVIQTTAKEKRHEDFRAAFPKPSENPFTPLRIGDNSCARVICPPPSSTRPEDVAMHYFGKYFNG